jgi:hypothetical protein
MRKSNSCHPHRGHGYRVPALSRPAEYGRRERGPTCSLLPGPNALDIA